MGRKNTRRKPRSERSGPLRTDGPAYESIGSYAVIGNGRSVALISRHSSIDWLCWPRFDSPSLFAGLLDARRGGRFSLTPRDIKHIEREYLGETNVLSTRYRTSGGLLRITDVMPVMSEEEKSSAIVPDHEILRIVECVEGSVVCDVEYSPRPEYGRLLPRVEERGRLGYICQHAGKSALLHTDAPLRLDKERGTVDATLRLEAGQQYTFSMTFSEGEPSVIPPLGTYARDRLERSRRWWEEWTGRCTYRGPYRREVLRSALTLKMLVYAPSGAVIAAPTTSLPEAIGAGRNWDYRYCWLRDASLSIAALLDLGYQKEGEAFLSWILHATRTTRPGVQILYDVFGASHVPESELSHLSGYRSSAPVRIGNAAHGQLQLDVYGEILLAAKEFADRGGTFDRSEARFLEGLGKVVLRRWREPDEGIWETRAGRAHHTYSKVMCWSALNTLIHLHDAGHVSIDRQRILEERRAIRQDIERHGYDREVSSYTGAYGQSYPDASLLLLGYVGFARAGDSHLASTYRYIRSNLSEKGLLRRYPPMQEGMEGREGVFGLCTLWEIQHLVREQKISQARKAFEQFLSYGNDVGLFAEEIDPGTGEALGNFPQAFTHLGIVDVALSLEDRTRTVRHHHRQVEEE